MDYAVALMIYIVSIIGVFYSMYCMVVFRKERWMVNLMCLTAGVFCVTTYIGGLMVQAIN